LVDQEEKMKIAFVGGGNMAQAILGGLIVSGQAAADCFAIEPAAAAREKLGAMGVAASESFQERALNANVIVIATKPQTLQEAVTPFAGRLTDQLIISIAAGIRTQDLSRWLGNYSRIVRTMPNTPALIHAGITGMFATPACTAIDCAAATKLLGAVGKTVWFDDEAMLDAVTAVSGSGPAYVFYFIEALETAALELGFSPEAARLFALETFNGGAKLAAQSAASPAMLRANVTSKRGTTESAIASFDAAALKAKIVAGVKAAAQRSRELGHELGAN
jgi:pyrroline-5-carboxylate reductase